ncbi:salivary glue protein Sgs-3-like [Nasonia vitripennis]|uniref:Uncharacterized protein n=1 Tax=Nasonia vitripennis TaxID=7425 RepID=A0A7M7M6I5_NASVI|nr:salivary glue protein Sgs-3-like [Nasonia vitripennis]
MQTEKQDFHTDKTTKIMSTDGPETTSTFGDVSTIIADNEDTSMDDLTAEETTLKLNRGINQRISDESRQTHEKRPHRKRPHTTHKATRPTTKQATTASTRATTTTTTTTTTETSGEAEDVTDETFFPPEITESPMTTEANENVTETLPPPTSSPTSPPTSTTKPSQPSFYPGYYYGGQPQDISNVQFTTQQPDIITNAVPARLQGFNSGNPSRQQFQPNYDNYDQSQSQSLFDYYSRYDQNPAESKDFFGKPLDFLNNGINTIDQLNGFKPSFPYYH